MLVAPALPTNDPKNTFTAGGGLGRKLRFAAIRAILQVPHPYHCTLQRQSVCSQGGPASRYLCKLVSTRAITLTLQKQVSCPCGSDCLSKGIYGYEVQMAAMRRS